MGGGRGLWLLPGGGGEGTPFSDPAGNGPWKRGPPGPLQVQRVWGACGQLGAARPCPISESDGCHPARFPVVLLLVSWSFSLLFLFKFSAGGSPRGAGARSRGKG